MNWSFKKKPKDEVIATRAERTSLFSRKPKAEDANIQDVEAVEVVEVVSVMADVYPDREPRPDEARTTEPLRVSEPVGVAGGVSAEQGAEVPLEIDAAAPAVTPVDAPKKEKKPLWKKSTKDDAGIKPAKAARPAKGAVPPPSEEGPRPLKVLIGFLPDSSVKDTYFYMLGVAQKNLDSENIGWAGLTRFENGYAYEIHEGGTGRGYLESIINHFRSLPTFAAEETHRAFIRTATRTVRVERTPTGLYSVVLPESDQTLQSDWLTTGKKLAPLVEKRTGLFVLGCIIFLSSLIALMGGYATRYQPYTPTLVSLERVPISNLPHAQWNKLTNLQPGDYVQALKFENNEWLVQTPSNPTGKSTPAGKPVTGKAVSGSGQRSGPEGHNPSAQPSTPAPAVQPSGALTASPTATPANAPAPTLPVPTAPSAPAKKP